MCADVCSLFTIYLCIIICLNFHIFPICINIDFYWMEKMGEVDIYLEKKKWKMENVSWMWIVKGNEEEWFSSVSPI